MNWKKCNLIITILVVFSFLCHDFAWAYGQDKLAKDTGLDDPELISAWSTLFKILDNGSYPRDIDTLDFIERAVAAGEISRKLGDKIIKALAGKDELRRWFEKNKAKLSGATRLLFSKLLGLQRVDFVEGDPKMRLRCLRESVVKWWKYSVYDDWIRFERDHDTEAEKKAVLAFSELTRDEDVLIAGPGKGIEEIEEMFKAAPNLKRLFVLDISKDNLDYIEQKLAGLPPEQRERVNLAQGSITDTAFETGQFKVIYSHSVIDPDLLTPTEIERAWEEVNRLLMDGESLFLGHGIVPEFGEFPLQDIYSTQMKYTISPDRGVEELNELVVSAARKKGIIGTTNTAVATKGMYTRKQHEKTNERIRSVIGGLAGVRVQDLRQEVWDSLDSETRQALEDVQIFLLPPEDEDYPYYLRTEKIEGKLEYQVAHAGTNRGEGRYIYITRQAFMELPVEIAAKILKRETKLAVERFSYRSMDRRPNDIYYDAEVGSILEEIEKYRLEHKPSQEDILYLYLKDRFNPAIVKRLVGEGLKFIQKGILRDGAGILQLAEYIAVLEKNGLTGDKQRPVRLIYHEGALFRARDRRGNIVGSVSDLIVLKEGESGEGGVGYKHIRKHFPDFKEIPEGEIIDWLVKTIREGFAEMYITEREGKGLMDVITYSLYNEETGQVYRVIVSEDYHVITFYPENFMDNGLADIFGVSKAEVLRLIKFITGRISVTIERRLPNPGAIEDIVVGYYRDRAGASRKIDRRIYFYSRTDIEKPFIGIWDNRMRELVMMDLNGTIFDVANTNMFKGFNRDDITNKIKEVDLVILRENEGGRRRLFFEKPKAMEIFPVNDKRKESRQYYFDKIVVNQERFGNPVDVVNDARRMVKLYKGDKERYKVFKMEINEAVDSYVIIEYGEKYFVVREKLLDLFRFSEEEFKAHLAAGLERKKRTGEILGDVYPQYLRSGKAEIDLNNLPEVVVVELMYASPYMGANCTGDGWIGINECLGKMQDKEFRDIIFESVLLHELWHEANFTSKEMDAAPIDTLFLFWSIFESGMAFSKFQKFFSLFIDNNELFSNFLFIKNKIIRELLKRMAGDDPAVRRRSSEMLIKLGQKFNLKTGFMFLGDMKNWLNRHGLLAGGEAEQPEGLETKKRKMYRGISRKKDGAWRDVSRFCKMHGIQDPGNTGNPNDAEKIIWWMVDAHFDEDLKIKGGTLFGKDIEGKKFMDLAIWPIDSYGRLRLDLMNWLLHWSWKRGTSEEYLNAKKVSLAEYCRMETYSTPRQIGLDFGTPSPPKRRNMQLFIREDLADETGSKLWRDKEWSGEELLREEPDSVITLDSNGDVVFSDEFNKKIMEEFGLDTDGVIKVLDIITDIFRLRREKYFTKDHRFPNQNIKLYFVNQSQAVCGDCADNEVVFINLKVIKELARKIPSLNLLPIYLGIFLSHEVLGHETGIHDESLLSREDCELFMLRAFGRGIMLTALREIFKSDSLFIREIKAARGRQRHLSDAVSSVYRELPRRYRRFLDKRLLISIVSSGRLPRNWPALAELIKKGNEARNAEIVAKIGRAVEEGAKETGLNDKQKAMIIEAISVQYFNILERIRIDLHKMGYGISTDEIVNRFSEIRDKAEGTGKEDYYFVLKLQELLGYPKGSISFRANLSELKGETKEKVQHLKDVFELNLRQWRLFDLLKIKGSRGVIVQDITDLGPGLKNWQEGLKRHGVNVNGVVMVYLMDGVSEEDRARIIASKPVNVILANNLDEIEGESIVYLARRVRLEKVKRKDVKLVERGCAGPVIELSLCLYLLDNNDYKPFLNKLVKLGLITNDEIESGDFIKLPKIEKCQEMWDSLEKGTTYLYIWA